jgi:hypothetical protein
LQWLGEEQGNGTTKFFDEGISTGPLLDVDLFNLVKFNLFNSILGGK